MTPHTPAAGLFRELSDIPARLLDMLTVPALQVGHWRTYCRLYMDVDELGSRVHATAQDVIRGFTDEIGVADVRRLETATDCLSRIGDCQRWIVDGLGYMARRALISCADKGLMHRLRCH